MTSNPYAFPSETTGHVIQQQRNNGMTLRDWFASQVLEQCIRNAINDDGGWEPGNVAYHAYLVADAMLKARDA
jgi:hypothetical protein